MSNDAQFEHRPADFVGVPHRNFVFVGLKDRAAFDKIDAPCRDPGPNANGHVLLKTIEQNGTQVVFQYWLKSLTHEAFLERCRAEKAAAAAAGRSGAAA